MTGRAITSAAGLVRAGLADPQAADALEAVAARYPLRLSRHVAALAAAEDGDGPVGRQYLPHPDELVLRADEAGDPIGDAAHSPLKGLVHRYPDRVLMKPTLACPVYCRFCFRREVVGPGGQAMSEADLDAAFAYVAARPAIREVIVTGGDPLMLAPRRLAALAERAAAVAHLRVLRFHSRVPVADPARVTDALVAALRRKPLATYLGVHVNHPRELGPPAREAIARLADGGIALVSQTVLLAGVNDDAAVLEELFRAFVDLRVRPYYLHHLDRAPGTARFRVPLSRGRALMRALRGRVSGLALPTYVVDIPGGRGKSPAGPDWLAADGAGWRIEDFRGGLTRIDD